MYWSHWVVERSIFSTLSFLITLKKKLNCFIRDIFFWYNRIFMTRYSILNRASHTNSLKFLIWHREYWQKSRLLRKEWYVTTLAGNVKLHYKSDIKSISKIWWFITTMSIYGVTSVLYIMPLNVNYWQKSMKEISG